MSKFDGILSAKPSGEVKTNAQTGGETIKSAKNDQSAKKDPSKRVGKRSDPAFTQITAYIKKTTHEDVMRKIYKRQEFSELLEDLLTDWLKKL